MANTPRIRFKGFNDDWEQRKVQDIYKITRGYVLAAPETNENPSDDMPYPVYSSQTKNNGLMGYYKDYLYEDAITWTTDGANAGTVNYRPGKFYCTNVCGVLLSDEGYANKCAAEALNNVVWRWVSHVGNPKLMNNVMGEISISLPKSIEEQNHISKFLEEIDNLITLHQRKYDNLVKTKKSMLQKMFPRDGATVPEIRFKGFTDDWEQRKLGEICERVTRKNKNGESDLPLTIASQYGLIDQRDFFNKVVAAKDMSNYYLLKKGEFAYNKSYSNGFDYGSIKRLNAYEQGCLSTLYICFGITSDDVESDYLECYFDTLKWYEDVSQICAEGARNHGLLNVDTKAFFDEVTIEMPSSKEEQKKISAYLNNLDNLITLHQRKCDTLKSIKKYMLQNMFPKED